MFKMNLFLSLCLLSTLIVWDYFSLSEVCCFSQGDHTNYHLLEPYKTTRHVLTRVDAMNYLVKYGYLGKNGTQFAANSKPIKAAVTRFQQFMGLSKTGILDKETMRMMNMPRCGVPDTKEGMKGFMSKKLNKRPKRYLLEGSVWPTNNLSWKMMKYSSHVNLKEKKSEIDEIVFRALNVWSTVSSLSFFPAGDGSPDIGIQFVTGYHEDEHPFDGEGRSLAHAFFPQFGGDVHFDDQENWTLGQGQNQGLDLLSVVLHELGHSLGLGHSREKTAVMFPSYRGKQHSLEPDDVEGIESLYGPPASPETQSLGPAPKGNPPKPEVPDICNNFKIDASTCTFDGCYFFRRDYVWGLDIQGNILAGYPQLIGNVFPGLEANIDASTDKVWIYTRPYQSALVHKQPISTVLKGLNVSNIDLAFRWGFTEKVYIFKNNAYWRYDFGEEVPVKKRYPMPVTNWRGLPTDGMDAAFQWAFNNKTYFFKNQWYWRFNDQTSSVDQASPRFPREASVWWLKCSEKRGRGARIAGPGPNVRNESVVSAKLVSVADERGAEMVETMPPEPGLELELQPQRLPPEGEAAEAAAGGLRVCKSLLSLIVIFHGINIPFLEPS